MDRAEVMLVARSRRCPLLRWFRLGLRITRAPLRARVVVPSEAGSDGRPEAVKMVWALDPGPREREFVRRLSRDRAVPVGTVVFPHSLGVDVWWGATQPLSRAPVSNAFPPMACVGAGLALLQTLQCVGAVAGVPLPSGTRQSYALDRVNGRSRTPRVVWVVGAGTLGCVALANLVMTYRPRTLIISDPDRVAPSNRPHQILFTGRDAERGDLKVEAAARGLRKWGRLPPLELREELVGEQGGWPSRRPDVILPLIDNLEGRAWIDKEGFRRRRIPVIHAGTRIGEGGGEVVATVHGRSACLACRMDIASLRTPPHPCNSPSAAQVCSTMIVAGIAVAEVARALDPATAGRSIRSSVRVEPEGLPARLDLGPPYDPCRCAD